MSQNAEVESALIQEKRIALSIRMNRGLYYLKQNVVAEPLVDGWYAWAHLIPPVTMSRAAPEDHGIVY